MDSSIALRYAITSVPVPGAPPRQNADGAAIGLSFLDSALRLNHIRRLSETLTVTDHRVARRTTEVDVSLAMLDEGQRRATVLSRDLRSASRSEDDVRGPDEVWVPVARIARRSTAPVTIWDTSGARRCPSSSIARLTSTSVVRRATRWSVTVRVSLSRRMWLSRSAESRNDSPIAAPTAFWRGGAPGTGTLVIA